MGRGSSTKQSNVVKHLQELNSSGGGLAGGNGTSNFSDEGQNCLFTFNISLSVPREAGIVFNIGDKAAIVGNLSSTGGLSIIVGGSNCGEYEGSYKSRIQRCMQKSYVYEGSVFGIKRELTRDILELRFKGSVR